MWYVRHGKKFFFCRTHFFSYPTSLGGGHPRKKISHPVSKFFFFPPPCTTLHVLMVAPALEGHMSGPTTPTRLHTLLGVAMATFSRATRPSCTIRYGTRCPEVPLGLTTRVTLASWSASTRFSMRAWGEQCANRAQWPLELGLGTHNPRFVAWPLELGLGTHNPRFFAWPLEFGLGTLILFRFVGNHF